MVSINFYTCRHYAMTYKAMQSINRIWRIRKTKPDERKCFDEPAECSSVRTAAASWVKKSKRRGGAERCIFRIETANFQQRCSKFQLSA